MKTFNNYLRKLHAKEYNGTDDNMSDAFESWLDKFDVAEILDLVEDYEANK